MPFFFHVKYFQRHILEIKLSYFYSNFTEICSKSPINNNAALVLIVINYQIRWPSLLTHIGITWPHKVNVFNLHQLVTYCRGQIYIWVPFQYNPNGNKVCFILTYSKTCPELFIHLKFLLNIASVKSKKETVEWEVGTVKQSRNMSVWKRWDREATFRWSWLLCIYFIGCVFTVAVKPYIMKFWHLKFMVIPTPIQYTILHTVCQHSWYWYSQSQPCMTVLHKDMQIWCSLIPNLQQMK